MRKLLRYGKGYRKEAVLGPFLKLCEATLELLIPYVVMAIVNAIESGEAAGGAILKNALLLVGMGLLGLLFSVSAQYFSARRRSAFPPVFARRCSRTSRRSPIGRSTTSAARRSSPG